MNIVELAQLRYRWKGQSTDILNIPELTIAQGEHVFLRGESGSGKTTLLNLLAGISLPRATPWMSAMVHSTSSIRWVEMSCLSAFTESGWLLILEYCFDINARWLGKNSDHILV